MLVALLAVNVYAAESFDFEVPRIEETELDDTVDLAAFKEDASELDAELRALLATSGWYEVRANGPSAPAGGALWLLEDALSVAPAFDPTSRVTVPDDDDYVTRSHVKVRRDAQGVVRAAAGGVVTYSFGCGTYTDYADWLVTYDERGNPDRFYVTENGHGEALVRHTATVGRVVYEGDLPAALDVVRKGRWIGCDLCEDGLLVDPEWSTVDVTHATYRFTLPTDADDAASGC